MAKHRTTVEQHYRHGRSHPHGRNTDDGAHHRVHHSPEMEPTESIGRTADESEGELGTPVHNSQEVQGAEGRHDAKYDNDVSADSWLRNGDATTKPGFDHMIGGRHGKR